MSDIKNYLFVLISFCFRISELEAEKKSAMDQVRELEQKVLGTQ